jgi:Tfp pilus assembly protein PilF
MFWGCIDPHFSWLLPFGCPHSDTALRPVPSGRNLGKWCESIMATHLSTASKPRESSAPRKEPRRSSRAWRLPPVLFRDPAAPEPFDGAGILMELSGPAAVLLWQTQRDVMLWALSRAEGIGHCLHLFTGDSADKAAQISRLADFEGEARTSLDLLFSILYLGGLDEPTRGSAAAMAIAEWAAGRGAWRTAVAFAQGASALLPADADAAFHVGRYALSGGGSAALAETWLRRAVGLARRSHDRATYAESYIALGRAYLSSGDTARAESALVSAARACRRSSVPISSGRAHAALLQLALARGDATAAERRSRLALQNIPRDHPERGPVLLQRAVILVRSGRASQGVARVLFRSAIASPGAEQVRTLALVIRALGGVARRERRQVRNMRLGEQAWVAAINAVASLGQTQETASAAFELGEACVEVGLHDRGVEAARFAYNTSRHDPATRDFADRARRFILDHAALAETARISAAAATTRPGRRVGEGSHQRHRPAQPCGEESHSERNDSGPGHECGAT